MADTAQGPGRVLVAVYGIFALAAGARSTVQIATRFDDAPVAYALSAFAAAVYVLATLGLARDGRAFRRWRGGTKPGPELGNQPGDLLGVATRGRGHLRAGTHRA